MQNQPHSGITAYQILGLERNVAQKDIHAALRKLALAWHPDRVPTWRRSEATMRFQAIMDAYNQIRTPDTRANYDEAIKGMNLNQMYRATISNDNVPFSLKARAWLKAFGTVFWPLRKE